MNDTRGPHYVAGSMLTATFISISMLLYLLIWPRPVIWVQEPLPVDPVRVAPCDPITLVIQYDKFRPAQSLSGIVFVSQGMIVPLPITMTSLPMGRHRVKIRVQVPCYTPYGNYRAYLTREYRTTPLLDTEHLFVSAPFDVVPAPSTPN